MKASKNRFAYVLNIFSLLYLTQNTFASSDCNEALQTLANEKGRGTTLKVGSSGFLMLDGDGLVLNANEKFFHIKGTNLQDQSLIIGHPSQELKEHTEVKMIDFKTTAANGPWLGLTKSGRWTGAYLNKKKTGELYVETVEAKVVQGATDLQIQILAQTNDITPLIFSEAARADLWSHYHDLNNVLNVIHMGPVILAKRIPVADPRHLLVQREVALIEKAVGEMVKYQSWHRNMIQALKKGEKNSAVQADVYTPPERLSYLKDVLLEPMESRWQLITQSFMNLEKLVSNEQDQKLQSKLSLIRKSVERGWEIIRNLRLIVNDVTIDLIQYETYQTTALELKGLVEVLRETTATLIHRFPNVQFIFDDKKFDSSKSIKTRIRETEILKVVSDLVQNALEAFSPDQELREIRLSLVSMQDRLQIAISDNVLGGIPRQFITEGHIANIGKTTKKNGTGMGFLNIDNIIINTKSALIVTTSDAGTTFSLEIPRY